MQIAICSPKPKGWFPPHSAGRCCRRASDAGDGLPARSFPELLPSGTAHTSPHGEPLVLTLPAHYVHTGVTPRHQHHPQTPAPPQNTSIAPQNQHLPQTPALPPNTSIAPKPWHGPGLASLQRKLRGSAQAVDALEVLFKGSAQAEAAQVNF